MFALHLTHDEKGRLHYESIGRPGLLALGSVPELTTGAPSGAASDDADAAAMPAGKPPLTRYPVGTRAAVLAHLELPVPESDLSPDERTLIQLLCDLLAPALVRLTGG